ncbi:MAG: hypothetical protein IPM48_05375 [Saprospiraceae bacterium]|nr:hypothetical protein [Saprospiraceae bacterium]
MKKSFLNSTRRLYILLLWAGSFTLLTFCTRKSQNHGNAIKGNDKSQTVAVHKVKKSVTKKSKEYVVKDPSGTNTKELADSMDLVDLKLTKMDSQIHHNNELNKDSLELENYFAELEKIEIDSSDFVLIDAN